MNSTEFFVRDECIADRAAVHTVNVAAFQQVGEADLVDRLRIEVSPYISLVTVWEQIVVGHILFTPVDVVSDHDHWSAMALGPMAVLPEFQKRGIGGALIKEGLHRCSVSGTPAVFVLGHPTYYPRFGFVPATQYGCRCTWDVPDDVLMIMRMSEVDLPGGIVRYDPAFDEVT